VQQARDQRPIRQPFLERPLLDRLEDVEQIAALDSAVATQRL